MRFLPALLIGSMVTLIGAASLITALIGSPKRFEESDNPRMQQLLERFGKAKLRIIYIVLGLVGLGWGLKLLYGIFFVNQ